MINQLLNRDFVLDQMRQVRKTLARPADQRRRAVIQNLPEATQLRIGDEDRRIALEELDKSMAKEEKEPSGQTPRIGTAPAGAPLDDWSFISSDPIISNLQTVLD